MLFAFHRWSKESQIPLEHEDGKKIKALRTYILNVDCEGDKKRPSIYNLHTSHHSHHGLGGYSKLINGLRAAASGAFVC